MNSEILVIGNGYLGNKVAEYFDCPIFESKINSQNDLDKAFEIYHPKFVVNCAGKTGRPNIDWCEIHKEETFFGNVVLPTYILSACNGYKAKMIHVGSGCIYQGDYDGQGFPEDAKPNHDESYYSWTKIVSERYLAGHDVLQLRIRMPLSSDTNPRNLISKLLKYTLVVNEPNSITYIPDLLYVMKQLINKNATGIYNVVNPGAITHDVILKKYEEISGKKLLYKAITVEELDALTLAKRSNCVLSTKKLQNFGIQIRSSIHAVDDCIRKYVGDSQ